MCHVVLWYSYRLHYNKSTTQCLGQTLLASICSKFAMQTAVQQIYNESKQWSLGINDRIFSSYHSRKPGPRLSIWLQTSDARTGLSRICNDWRCRLLRTGLWNWWARRELDPDSDHTTRTPARRELNPTETCCSDPPPVRRNDQLTIDTTKLGLHHPVASWPRGFPLKLWITQKMSKNLFLVDKLCSKMSNLKLKPLILEKFKNIAVHRVDGASITRDLTVSRWQKT